MVTLVDRGFVALEIRVIPNNFRPTIKKIYKWFLNIGFDFFLIFLFSHESKKTSK